MSSCIKSNINLGSMVEVETSNGSILLLNIVLETVFKPSMLNGVKTIHITPSWRRKGINAPWTSKLHMSDIKWQGIPKEREKQRERDSLAR